MEAHLHTGPVLSVAVRNRHPIACGVTDRRSAVHIREEAALPA
jgi:hypothetical protein